MVEKKKTKYIPLPIELYNEIQRIVKENRNLGFLSVPDFVRDAVRDKIIQIENKVRENKHNRNNSFIDAEADTEVFEGEAV
jgi:metal-responsive CopG/Arc/MetJ family transcriptional regulator